MIATLQWKLQCLTRGLLSPLFVWVQVFLDVVVVVPMVNYLALAVEA